MRWFKHLTNASADYKILQLETKYGHLGYAFYWKIVEFMAAQWTGFGEPEVETTFSYLRQLLRTQEPKIKTVLEEMKNIGLLDYNFSDQKLTIRLDALKDIRDNSSQKSIDNRGIKRELKEYIVRRDNKQCVYCDQTLLGKSLNFDHFIPLSLGGESLASNIVLSCDKCNKIKGMQHPNDIENGPYSFASRISKIRTKLSLEVEVEVDYKKKKKVEENISSPKRKVEVVEAEKDLNKKVWESFKNSYESRYKVEPVRNASINAKISQLAKRLGPDSIEIVKFFVFHNEPFYLKNLHAIGLCLKDAESLHTQWKRGKAITSSDVRAFEKNNDLDAQLERLAK